MPDDREHSGDRLCRSSKNLFQRSVPTIRADEFFEPRCRGGLTGTDGADFVVTPLTDKCVIRLHFGRGANLINRLRPAGNNMRSNCLPAGNALRSDSQHSFEKFHPATFCFGNC